MTKKIPKNISGIALNDSQHKTVKVLIENFKTHPIYKKKYPRSRKYLVHTNQEIKKGQKVFIKEARPISKRKSWQAIKIE